MRERKWGKRDLHAYGFLHVAFSRVPALKQVATFLALLPPVLSAGCMTFNGGGVPKVANRPPEYASVVDLKVGNFAQTLNGAGTARGMWANNTMAMQTANWICMYWKRSKLISEYGPIGKLSKPPDYTLTISGSRDEQGSILGAVFTGLSLYLFPSSAVLTYDLELDLQNNQTGKSYHVHAKDSFFLWQHLIFLPVLPLQPVGCARMQRDMSAFIYSEFAKQGAFGGQNSQSVK